jgi:microcin C transport system substrate-binding protein
MMMLWLNSAATPLRRSSLFTAFKYVAVIAMTATVLTSAARADEKRHALSLIGEPKYGLDFKHFDYVNPNAPKGGQARLGAQGTFDNFNIATFKGNPVIGLGLIYDQLMVSGLDQAATEYGQLAEWASYPPDYSSVTYHLREGSRWHDGKPVTPEDVIFSMNLFRSVENSPQTALYYKNVERVEKTGDRDITFYFNQKNNRELPFIVGEINILPKHYYDGVGPDGVKRDPTKTTLEPPLGSGPYKIKSFEAGHAITYERVKDYWGEKLPVHIGQNNFNEIRYDYYKDGTILFQAFTAGKTDFHAENSATRWAKGYDFPAVKASKVIKRDDVELKLPRPFQGFLLNSRKAEFADPKVRRALSYALDFEWLNQNIFFGQYRRVSSYFENTDMAGRGLPEGKELEVLNSVRDQVPPEVFTAEYKNPVGGTQENVRVNLREAQKLLGEAGWEVKAGMLTNTKTGQPFTMEILLDQETMVRIADPFVRNLALLGIDAKIRLVDDAQYERRRQDFNYDVIVGGYGQSESPGNEQRQYWTSEAADRTGSRNWMGIKNPAVDKLVDRVVFAKDREDLIAACRALDRVLLWNFYAIPQWYAPKERFAYWQRFSSPEPLPSRSVGFPTIWWYDEAKAAHHGLQ